jgi:16S rRNA (cytosine967-C5)-methyltransferase
MVKKKHFEKENNQAMNARQIAVRILTRVEKEGAYANLLLRTRLFDIRDPRERNLATALVNGVLKNKLLLDFALRKYLTKPMSALPHEIRAALRIGIFQILFLDKVPAPVAINETVEIVKTINKAFGPLANSVLRRSAETGWEFRWPDKTHDPVRYLSVRYSHPDWMVKRWYKRWGLEETERLLTANNDPPATCIRVNTLKTTKEELKELLQAEDVKVLESKRIPEALYIEDFGASKD